MNYDPQAVHMAGVMLGLTIARLFLSWQSRRLHK